jgi:hypothetical protein
VSHFTVRLFSPLNSNPAADLWLSLTFAPEKLINAWRGTPTKWYPIPIAVGALLLVAIRYRKKSIQVQKEVQVDKDGREVIKLRGPWQVCVLLQCSLKLRTPECTQFGGLPSSLVAPAISSHEKKRFLYRPHCIAAKN